MVELREQAGSLYHSDDAFGNSPRSQDANALDRGLTAQIPAVICALIGPNLDIGGILLVKSDPLILRRSASWLRHAGGWGSTQ